MGHKKPTETTRSYLENAPLPNYSQSYTVVSHKDVIDTTHTLLTNHGFIIKKEIYRSNQDGKVVQGIYHLESTSIDPQIANESEMGMMFAWTNSYDKSARFQCAIGAYVFVCANGMINGDLMNFGRKHTGSAFSDIQLQIMNQITHAEQRYKKILADRDSLRNTPLVKRSQAELLGRLFIDKEILDITQLSAVKSEIDHPSFDYNSDPENAWTFYNHVTTALKKSHPRTWLSDSRKFHEFMVADLLTPAGIKTYSENINSDFHVINTMPPEEEFLTDFDIKNINDIEEINEDDLKRYILAD